MECYYQLDYSDQPHDSLRGELEKIDDIQGVDSIVAERCGLKTLDGLESCTGLRQLVVNANEIRNVGPLAGLKELSRRPLGTYRLYCRTTRMMAQPTKPSNQATPVVNRVSRATRHTSCRRLKPSAFNTPNSACRCVTKI